jgi:5-deoxy-glucuronate isomerase
MQYTAENLIVHSNDEAREGAILNVTPPKAGWDYIHFEVRRLPAGRSWTFETDANELALILLSGVVDVASNRGEWNGVGQRRSVFDGLPFALYLPADTAFAVTARVDAEFGVAWTPTHETHPPQLITPDDVKVEIRGGDNATRAGVSARRSVPVCAHFYPGHHPDQSRGADCNCRST